MKARYWLLLLVFFSKSLWAQSPDSLAPAPPMGWNSYNSFGSAVHEDEVKANARYMAGHLKPHGWQYIVVDFCWDYPNPPGSTVGNPSQFRLWDGSYVPWLNMDAYGRLLPDERKFPSARDGKGFKPLADYVHSLGLKFGIHIMRGIPRQAVWAKCPVKDADGIDASMIVDTSSICPWLNHMWGVDMRQKGAQAYYNSLADLYASWGVDFIKMDDMNQDRGDLIFFQPEAEAMHKAILQCGRPIVLSLSPGQVYKNHEALVANANMYRITGDFWDNWTQLKKQFDHCNQWSNISGPGHWPDADMLQLGRISKRGPVGPPRYTNFTRTEQRTHITLWCIFRSPLMMGGNMPEDSPFTDSLLTNDEVLAVDQHSVNSRQLYRKDETVVWVSQVPGTGEWNLAFFNLNEEPREVSLSFADLGIRHKCRVRDLWDKKDIGVFKKKFTQIVAPHGSALFKLSPL